MNFKDVAVKNEQRLKNKVERLSALLYNALVCLEEEQVFDTHNRMLDYLAMTEKEYCEVMNNE